MPQVAMGPDAFFYLEQSDLDEGIYILWLNPDLPGVDPNSLCFGTQAQLKWIGEGLSAYHRIPLNH